MKKGYSYEYIKIQRFYRFLAKRTGISINAFIKQALEKQIMTML